MDIKKDRVFKIVFGPGDEIVIDLLLVNEETIKMATQSMVKEITRRKKEYLEAVGKEISGGDPS